MIVVALLAAAQPLPPSPDPQAAWRTEKGDLGCRTSRAPEVGSAIRVGFETELPSRRVVMVVEGIPGLGNPDGTVAVRLADGTTLNVRAAPWTVAKEARVLLFPDTAQLARIAAATTVSFGSDPRIVGMPDTAAALSALADCTVKVMRSWGIDLKLFASPLAQPTGNFDRWFNSADYPRGGALLRQGSTRVVMLLRTRKNGSVADCRTLVSPDPELGVRTCTIAIAHVRVVPPHDASGSPLDSYAVLPIVWTVR